MNTQAVPESRAYRHLACGNETEVGGQAFETVSNPMSSMEQTQCSGCTAMFPISQFAWVDTGETLSDYYARHTQNATDLQRFLCSKKFMVGVILVCILLTEIGVYFLMRNSGVGMTLFVMLGGVVVGGFIGMALFVSGFADPIKRKVCGVSDTRTLQ